MIDQNYIRICDGIANMHFPAVTAMLARAFWSKGITEGEVRHAAKHSALVVGAFSGDAQVGYARVISDKTRFAYITDVYVDEAYRNLGIGKKISRHILQHQELRLVYQWLLLTAHAREFYANFGFAPLSRANDMLEIRNPRPLDRLQFFPPPASTLNG